MRGRNRLLSQFRSNYPSSAQFEAYIAERKAYYMSEGSEGEWQFKEGEAFWQHTDYYYEDGPELPPTDMAITEIRWSASQENSDIIWAVVSWRQEQYYRWNDEWVLSGVNTDPSEGVVYPVDEPSAPISSFTSEGSITIAFDGQTVTQTYSGTPAGGQEFSASINGAEIVIEYVGEGVDEEEAQRLAEQDALEERNRIINSVFSPVIAQIMNAVGAEFAEFYENGLKVLVRRTLQEAEGINLDILGSLVGISREIYTGEIAEDAVYRDMLKAKIFKNHSKFASTPELRVFIHLLLGENVSFMRTGALQATLVAKNTVDVQLIAYLLRQLSNYLIDSFYVLPVPPTVDVISDYFIPVLVDENDQPCTFAPDCEVGRVDFARATVSRAI